MDNIDNLNKKYFYALSDAQEYDATIRLTVPLYDLLHQTVIDILNYHFGYVDNVNVSNIEGLILDIGAGTGIESIAILKNFPKLKALAIDIAEPMKIAFVENYHKHIKDNIDNRVQYLIGSVFDIDLSNIKKILDTNKKELNHKAAVSAYCIHHFPIKEKELIYKKMYDFLDDGGILINLDLFNYESQTISKYAHHFDIEFIKREFDNPSDTFQESKKLPIDLRNDLKNKWVNHMEHDNILDSIESQIEILKKIGFSNVECIFKYYQQGILIATK